MQTLEFSIHLVCHVLIPSKQNSFKHAIHIHTHLPKIHRSPATMNLIFMLKVNCPNQPWTDGSHWRTTLRVVSTLYFACFPIIALHGDSTLPFEFCASESKVHITSSCPPVLLTSCSYACFSMWINESAMTPAAVRFYEPQISFLFSHVLLYPSNSNSWYA